MASVTLASWLATTRERPIRARLHSFRQRSSYQSVGRRVASGVGRLRTNGWPILQTAAAASIAYLLASFVLGNEQPFFAPIAAVVTLGLSLGQRGRRAFEIALGVALGLGIADLLVRVIGVGALQIGIVVVLAMAAAVLLGEGTLLVNQAAISAILVVLLQPPGSGFSPDRFFNALVGGGRSSNQPPVPGEPGALGRERSEADLRAVGRRAGRHRRGPRGG